MPPRRMWPYGGGRAKKPSPNPLGTLFAWYDFADTSTITLDGSGKISLILDKTGNGHNASQSVAAKRPGQTTVNGLNAGAFNSASQTVLQAGPGGWPSSLGQPYTFACVWTQTVGASANYQPGPYGGLGPPAPAPPILFDNFDNTQLVMLLNAHGFGTAKSAPYTQQATICKYDGTTSILELNAAATGGTVDGLALTNIALGTTHNPTDAVIMQHMDGALCELLVYIGHLNGTQDNATNAYLKGKWATP